MNERNESDTDTDTEEELFAKRAKALFDQSAQAIDGHTLSRLNRARQVALAEAERRPGSTIRIGQWLPAAGVAAAAVLAVVIWSGDSPMDPLAPTTTAGDLELLLDEDSFEMLEDLEFYAWLDLEAPAADADDNVG